MNTRHSHPVPPAIPFRCRADSPPLPPSPVAQVLDFRSHAYHGTVMFEVYLKEPTLRVSGCRPFPPSDEARIRARQGELLRVFAPIFGGGGSCVLERWVPGAEAVASAAAARRAEAAGAGVAGVLGGEDSEAGSGGAPAATGQGPSRYSGGSSPRPLIPAHSPLDRSPPAPHLALSGSLPTALAPTCRRGSTAMEEEDQVGERSYKYWARQQQGGVPFPQAGWAEWGVQPGPLPPPAGVGLGAELGRVQLAADAAATRV